MKFGSILKMTSLALLGVLAAGTAQAKLWFENPTLKATVVSTKVPDGQDPHYLNKSEDDQYLGLTWSTSPAFPLELYSLPALEALNGTATDVQLASMNIAALEALAGVTGVQPKGCAISFEHNMILIGEPNLVTQVVGAPLTNGIANQTWTTSKAYTKSATTGFDGIDFGHEGNFLYTDNYTKPREQILQWAIDDTAGTLTLSNTWVTACTRVRSVNCYYINGKDYLFFGEGGSNSGNVFILDTTTGASSVLCTLDLTGATISAESAYHIMNVKVSGVGSKQMHVYVQLDGGDIYIYNLASDLTATFNKRILASELFNSTVLGYSGTAKYRDFEVSNDGRFAFLTTHGGAPYEIFVLWGGPDTPVTQWWANPSVKSSVNLTNAYWAGAVYDGHTAFKGQEDDYLFVPTMSTGGTATGFLVYDIPFLTGLTGVHSLAHLAQASDTGTYAFYPAGNQTWRGGAYSASGKFFLCGSNAQAYETLPFLSMDGITQCDPLSTVASWTLGVNATLVTPDLGGTTKTFNGDQMFFSHNGEYLFSNSRTSADRGILFQWKVMNDWSLSSATSSGKGLKLVKTFATPCSRIRSMTARYMAGRDIIYYAEGKGSAVATYRNVYVLDPLRGTSTLLCTLPAVTEVTSSGNFVMDVQNISVSGEDTDTPYLYIACDGGTIFIYQLAHDGLSIVGTQPVKTIPWRETFALCQNEESDRSGEIYKFRNFVVTSDGKYAFMAHYNSQPPCFLQTVWTDPAATHTLVYNGDGLSTWTTVVAAGSHGSGIPGIMILASYAGPTDGTIDIPTTVYDENYFAYAVIDVSPITAVAKAAAVTAESGNIVTNSAIYSADMTTLSAYLCGSTNVVYTVPASVETISSGAFMGASRLLAIDFQGLFRPSMGNAFDSTAVGYYGSSTGDWELGECGLAALYNRAKDMTAVAALEFLHTAGLTNATVKVNGTNVNGAQAVMIAASIGIEPILTDGVAAAQFQFAISSFTADGTTATLVAKVTASSGNLSLAAATGRFVLLGRTSLADAPAELSVSGVVDSDAGTVTFTGFNPNGSRFFSVVNK